MKEFWIESITGWLVETDIKLDNKIGKETNKSKTIIYSAGDKKDKSNNIISKTIIIHVNSIYSDNHYKFYGRYLIFDKTLILLDVNCNPCFIPWNSILFIEID